MPGPWRRARLVERVPETETARTLVFSVPAWPGHLAGQHIDVRLTAEDGYQAVRSYSLSAPPGDGLRIAVQPVPDGEVSPYLADDLPVGAEVQIRGPLGGWFVWHPERRDPVLLVAGGSGVAPLAAMLRVREQAADPPPFRLAYSLRDRSQRWFGADLDRFADADGVDVSYVYTRVSPEDHPRPVGRMTAADLDTPGWRPDDRPLCFVCGPTVFVEHAAGLLVGIGHDAARIRTERFG
ncbi:FAD-binding oxidoreductase [Yinghuangia sp. YIM S10712]|uniref:FAD-binding oxidoreductase n=1 Tax=Yinghuangia sp. YIM S10712 TaxID=3436930 RepID=UPI003F5372C8